MPRIEMIRALLIVMGIAAALAGCGPSGEQPVAAGGRVLTIRGEPCEGALVVFHPQEESRRNAAKPVAVASADGSFTLTTHSEGDGAIPGTYGVTIVWNRAAPEKKLSLSSEGGGGVDQLQGRYGNPSQPRFEVRVEPAGQNSFEFKVE